MASSRKNRFSAADKAEEPTSAVSWGCLSLISHALTSSMALFCRVQMFYICIWVCMLHRVYQAVDLRTRSGIELWQQYGSCPRHVKYIFEKQYEDRWVQKVSRHLTPLLFFLQRPNAKYNVLRLRMIVICSCSVAAVVYCLNPCANLYIRSE